MLSELVLNRYISCSGAAHFSTSPYVSIFKRRDRGFGMALGNWQSMAFGQTLIPESVSTLAADAEVNETPSASAIQFEIFANRPQWSGAELLPVVPPSISVSEVTPTAYVQALPQAPPALPPSQDPNCSDMGEVQPPNPAVTGSEGEERPLIPDRGENFGTIRLPPMPKRDVKAKDRKVEAEFSDGLTVKTDDGYFSLTFHNLTQVDGRFFNPTGNPLTDNFIVPRQRWYVLGNVSPNIRYYTVINRGYGSLDLLDAFRRHQFRRVDAEKLQFRVGRMKTPYTYEYIKISETDLIAPERSVFVGNLAAQP